MAVDGTDDGRTQEDELLAAEALGTAEDVVALPAAELDEVAEETAAVLDTQDGVVELVLRLELDDDVDADIVELTPEL